MKTRGFKMLCLIGDPTCKVTVEILHHLHEMLLSKPDFSRLNPRPFIAKLDCFDWPAVCQENNVSVYPTLKIITGTDKRIYLGPLEATSILRALLL